jgi:hypothetical protein
MLDMTSTVLRATLALASVGAGVIHFMVTGEHFEEYVPFGVFFLALAIFQVVWAGAVWARPNAFILWSGVLVSAFTIGVWILSRTAGLPIGPEVGEAEAFGLLDTLASALEAMIVLVGAYLLTIPWAKSTGQEAEAPEVERRAA